MSSTQRNIKMFEDGVHVSVEKLVNPSFSVSRGSYDLEVDDIETARDLLDSDGVRVNVLEHIVVVDSESEEDKSYVIEAEEGGFLKSCTCPHHEHRGAWCKHMDRAEERLQSISMVLSDVRKHNVDDYV